MLLSLGLPTQELCTYCSLCGTLSSAHFLQSIWSPVVTAEAVYTRALCALFASCRTLPHMLIKADGIWSV